MPRSKLAMVAAVGSHEGPWSYVNGVQNIVVEVRGLGDVAGLNLEQQVGKDRGVETVSLNPGRNVVAVAGCLRYRVVKTAPKHDSTPTTVEVFPDANSGS